MEVRVDPLVCELDDDDNLEVLQPHPPAELVDRVRHAVRSCPKAALTLTE
jgi:ferredoxin